MKYNPLQFIRFHTALLQLEEYDLARFLRKAIIRWNRPPVKLRKNIRWTPKLSGVFVLALGLLVAAAWFLARISGLPAWTGILFGLLGSYVFFIFLLFSALAYMPVDFVLKRVIIKLARRKMENFKDLKIIGIAGSYGKTTMKEMIAAVLSARYRVVKTPENINTPLGISGVILRKLKPEHEIFIVEMGEYTPGDIEYICSLTRPDVAVVTGINEAHMERMGNLMRSEAAIFEAVTHARDNALLLLNYDDEVVRKSSFIADRDNIIWYSREKNEKNNLAPKNVRFDQNGGGWSFDLYENKTKLGGVKLPHLGGYAIADCIGVVKLARKLGLNWREISAGLGELKPVPHRLQPIFNQSNNVLVIDDSYNGNPAGVREAVDVLSRFANRRRVCVTPGLVETGKRTREVHTEIGNQLAKVADLVVLIENSVTKSIASGLADAGFEPTRILWYETANQMTSRVGEFVRPGDVVLFQNDWPDNYF